MPLKRFYTPPLNFNGAPAPLNLRYSEKTTTLANGANHNIDRQDANYLRIDGPTGAFSMSGFNAPIAGIPLYVYVTVAEELTIKDESGSVAANQIYTGTGADIVTTATPCLVTFHYDSSVSRWMFASATASQITQTGWDEEVYTISGTLSTNTGKLRLYNRSSSNWGLSYIYISVGTPPTGTSLIVDVIANTTSIFATTTTNRPTITSGGSVATSGTPDVVTVVPGDYLTIDVLSVGTTAKGADLTVQIPVSR